MRIWRRRRRILRIFRLSRSALSELASSARWPSSPRPSSPGLPPTRTGEEGEVCRKKLFEPSLSRQVGGEAGRERVGRVRARPEGAVPASPGPLLRSPHPMHRYLCIHGHFYQPPRENPWLEAIEVQDSARPYHDWNERITAECYGPNAASRILDGEHRIERIVNNYAQISFNFGPTLLVWLEEKKPEVYRSILA